MKHKIIINNIKIESLKPIRDKFKNKNDNLSAKGYFKDIKIKVYETFDKNQGELRAFISNNKYLKSYFPKLIAYNDRYIVEEWINGKTLKEVNNKNLKTISQSSEIKEFIKLMWYIRYENKVFDYIDYIYKRVNEKNNLDLSKIPIRINHNDLSLDNILVTQNGLKIIDNEFLGCNSGWILNIKNSFINEDFEYQKFISEESLNELWNVRTKWTRISYKNKFIYKFSLSKIIRIIISKFKK